MKGNISMDLEVIYDESDEEGLAAWQHAHQPEEWR